MAKSRARKMKEKMIREGRMDPGKMRGIYALADLGTRKGKTKHEKLYQNKYGELSSIDENQLDGGSFYFGKKYGGKMSNSSYRNYLIKLLLLP